MVRIRGQDVQIAVGILLLLGGTGYAYRSWKNMASTSTSVSAESASEASSASDRKKDGNKEGQDRVSLAGGKSRAGGEVFDAVSAAHGRRLPRFAGALPRLRNGIDAQGLCASIEFPGQGTASLGWTDAEWKQVAQLFETTRTEFSDWIKREKRLEARARDVMKTQLGLLRIDRPDKDEPDLAWRGVAIWGLDDNQSPVVRVGAGFRTLMSVQPARARFELARAIAQSWAPCELMRLNTPVPFERELSCIGVKTGENCAQGTYSEAGWALSTFIAREIADPGCGIPAFESKGVASCVTQLSRDVASVGGSK